MAQRRLAWRWTVWYLQKYHLYILGFLSLLIAAAYFAGVRLPWPQPGTPPTNPVTAGLHPSASQQPSPVEAPTPVPQTAEPAVSVAPITTDEGSEPLALRPSLQLSPPAAQKVPDAPIPAAPPDTLSLQPENWLHSKEP